ncbi:MAG: hypothetical protein ACRDWI_12585 [Jiangellaceae bacterium]
MPAVGVDGIHEEEPGALPFGDPEGAGLDPEAGKGQGDVPEAGPTPR